MNPIARLNAALAARYIVQREVGTGGMATVYLAEDQRHHRRVAIKVLREDLSATVGAARFLREIEIAAQLQHPNILPLLDSGDADGLLYFVMPFVEGQSLRQRLQREQELPVGEAVRLLVEVVDALSHAHAHGVVHRDIKPDNVMLSGRHALVADFGVARAVSEATHGNTITTLGIALGTPAYMSPEQAMADPHVDHRTDLYAVGVMAYELLSGRPPFTDAQPQQVLAAHVTQAPDPIAKRRPALSPELSHAVMRCLEKRPADRWQSAADLLAVLEPLATPSGGTAPTEARLAAVKRRPVWPIVAAVTGLVAIGAVAAMRFVRASRPSLSIGHSSQLTSDAGLQIHPAISPDGKLVAYAAGSARRMRIFIRPVGGGRTIPLSDDSTAVETEPRWSPDGSRLLFRVRGGVSTAPAFGGSARAVIPGRPTRRVTTATWSPDGREIAFARGDSLLISPAEGQTERFVAKGFDLGSCSWSRTGVIACVSGNSEAMNPGGTFANIAPSSIVTVPATGGTFSPVTDSKTLNQSPEWSPDGDILYFISNRDGRADVYEVAIGRNGRARGAPIRLTTGLNAHSMSIAADGKHLSYAVLTARANAWSMPIPATGVASAETATQLTNGAQVIEFVRPSRDGKWLLYDSDRDGNANIYRIPLSGGEPEQLTHETFNVFAPDLTADGKLLTYHSFRGGTRDIEVKPLDGGPVEIVTNTPAQESYPAWSPDGTRLAYYDQNTSGQLSGDLSVVRRLGPGKWSAPVSLAKGMRPEWSPAGREIVFRSADSSSILIAPADSGPVRTVYTRAPGGVAAFGPMWSADGKLIYFKSFDPEGRAAFYSIPASGGTTPRLLVRFPDLSRPSNRADFGVDAKRFYFVIEDRQSNVWIADVAR